MQGFLFPRDLRPPGDHDFLHALFKNVKGGSVRLGYDRLNDVLPDWLLPLWMRRPGGAWRWLRHTRALITDYYNATLVREKELAMEAKLGRKKKRVGRAARGLAGVKGAKIVSDSESDNDEEDRDFDDVDIIGYVCVWLCVCWGAHVGFVLARRFMSQQVDDLIAWADEEVGPLAGVRISKRRQTIADDKAAMELEAAMALGGKAARKAKAKHAKRKRRKAPVKSKEQVEREENLARDVDEVRVIFRKLIDVSFKYVSGPTRFSVGNGGIEWAVSLQQLDLLRVFFRDLDPDLKAAKRAAAAAEAKAEKARKKKEREKRRK